MNIFARSVFRLSAVFGGAATGAFLSAPITAVEHAMIRPCDDDVCSTATIHAYEKGEIVESTNTGTTACIDGGEDSGTNFSIDGSEGATSNCCRWWKARC